MVKMLEGGAMENTTGSIYSFEEELTDLINKYSQENQSDTPDFILANYVKNCLAAFTLAVKARDKWYDYLDKMPGTFGDNKCEKGRAL